MIRNIAHKAISLAISFTFHYSRIVKGFYNAPFLHFYHFYDAPTSQGVKCYFDSLPP